MEQEEKPQHSGGIYNYFQGVTIHNMVINGNMTRNGTENYYGQEQQAQHQYADQKIADAISSICGENLPLDDKQKWMGVCCLVRAKYGYPYDLESCCKRLAGLPYKTKPFKECDYGSVRKLTVYGFAREPYDKWPVYRPNNTERKHFDACFNVARELESAIEKMTNND